MTVGGVEGLVGEVEKEVAGIGCIGDFWAPVWVDDSRPSHMSVLRKRRLAEGSGRRYIERTSGLIASIRIANADDIEFGAGGHFDRDPEQPFFR